MIEKTRWPRILVIVGLIGMAVGVLDPLEGSIVIIPSIGVAAIGLLLGHRRQRRTLYWALVLATLGVGVMIFLSALGGIGGTTGRSLWWALAILPYPAGWLLALIGAIRALRDDAQPGMA